MAASCNRESEKSQHGGGNGSARNRSLRIFMGASIVRSAFRTARSATNRVKKLGCAFRAGSTLVHTVVARDGSGTQLDRIFQRPRRSRFFATHRQRFLIESPDCLVRLGRDRTANAASERTAKAANPPQTIHGAITFFLTGVVLEGPFLPPGQAPVKHCRGFHSLDAVCHELLDFERRSLTRD